MKIAYASDLHVEFDGHKVPSCPPVDVLILAGDISSKGRGLQWAYDTYRDAAQHILVVYGNHDFWGLEFHKALAEARALARGLPNVFFLEDEIVCINGVWFIGSTLWTDYKLSSNPYLTMAYAGDAHTGMKDHRRIKFKKNGAYGRFRPEEIVQINAKSAGYIFDQIKQARALNMPVVVVTHHGPTELSLDDYYAGSPLNPCYVNTYGNRFANGEGPDVWIHGHIHDDKDYTIGRTRVLCNPIGYPGQIRGSGIRVLELSTDE